MTLNKPKKIATGTPFEFGEHRLHFGEEIVELADSTSLLNNPGALHRKMREDGYLFIRGFHPREHAEKAARWTLQAIAQNGGLKLDTPVEDGIIGEANQTFSFFRQLRWLMPNRFLMLWIASERCSFTKNFSVVQLLRLTNDGFAAWRRVDTTIFTTIAFTLGAAHRTATRCGVP